MLEITWKLKKAKIWYGDVPTIHCTEPEIVERVLEARVSRIASQRSAAIELYVPTGARVLYGLVGARFCPAEDNVLRVRVLTTRSLQPRLIWSMASNLDQVHIGLPYEFLDYVFDGTDAASSQLGSGVLVYDLFAHGLIGTTGTVIQSLSRLVVELLSKGVIVSDELKREMDSIC